MSRNRKKKKTKKNRENYQRQELVLWKKKHNKFYKLISRLVNKKRERKSAVHHLKNEKNVILNEFTNIKGNKTLFGTTLSKLHEDKCQYSSRDTNYKSLSM